MGRFELNTVFGNLFGFSWIIWENSRDPSQPVDGELGGVEYGSNMR